MVTDELIVGLFDRYVVDFTDYDRQRICPAHDAKVECTYAGFLKLGIRGWSDTRNDQLGFTASK